jgi:hypothetical protein
MRTFDKYKNFLVNTGAYRADALETVFIARQLVAVETAVYEKKYPEFKGRMLVPKSPLPEGATFASYSEQEEYGTARIISSGADDLPEAEVSRSETLVQIYTVGNSYSYSVMDLKKAAFDAGVTDGGVCGAFKNRTGVWRGHSGKIPFLFLRRRHDDSLMGIFTVSHRDKTSKARAGVLMTAHGPIETPVFMPVGTQGSVKTLSSDDVWNMGYRIKLANTYHLFLRPGQELLQKAGGLHKFISWPGALLTDSGGYQVLSLAARCKITEDGAEFSSHIDGARCSLTPEIATAFQLAIGSDIAMCLDDCPPYPSLEKDARESLERTIRWAKRKGAKEDGQEQDGEG